MVQDVQVHQLDEFASRDCGNVRVEVTIRDSMGPAAKDEVASSITSVITVSFTAIDRIGTLPLALRLHRHPRPCGRLPLDRSLFNGINKGYLESARDPPSPDFPPPRGDIGHVDWRLDCR